MVSATAKLAAVFVAGLFIAGVPVYFLAPGGGGSTVTSTVTATTTVSEMGSTTTASGGAPITLNVCSFGAPLSNFFTEQNPAIAEFEAANNVKIAFQYSYTCETNIVATKANQQYDIAMVDDTSIPTLAQEGVLVHVNSSVVPNMAKVDQHFVIPNYGVAFLPSFIGIAYNTNYVNNASAPKTWADLWNPQFAGKVGIVLPPHTVGDTLIIEATALKGGSYLTDVTPGIQYISQLKPNVGLASKSAYSLDQALVKGDVWVSVMSYGDYLYYHDLGAPIAWVETGHYYTLAAIPTVVAGRSVANTAMAFKFINYILTPTVQTLYGIDTYYIPANPAASLPAHYVNLGMSTTFFDNIAYENATYVALHAANWTDQFNAMWSG